MGAPTGFIGDGTNSRDTPAGRMFHTLSQPHAETWLGRKIEQLAEAFSPSEPVEIVAAVHTSTYIIPAGFSAAMIQNHGEEPVLVGGAIQLGCGDSYPVPRVSSMGGGAYGELTVEIPVGGSAGILEYR